MIACLAGAWPAWPQHDPAPAAGLAIEIGVELHRDGGWQAVDGQTVFHNNDEIRFRFRSSVGGYLYVLDRTSGGDNVWLFPRPGQGQSSRVEPGPEYWIPDARGSFVVAGAPGFDVTYWVLSPVPIEPRATSPPPLASQPGGLLPRCRTAELQARGICTDERAGPHPGKPAADNPIPLPGSERLMARDLRFHSAAGSTHISAPHAGDGIVFYEFHIAHR